AALPLRGCPKALVLVPDTTLQDARVNTAAMIAPDTPRTRSRKATPPCSCATASVEGAPPLGHARPVEQAGNVTQLPSTLRAPPCERRARHYGACRRRRRSGRLRSGGHRSRAAREQLPNPSDRNTRSAAPPREAP